MLTNFSFFFEGFLHFPKTKPWTFHILGVVMSVILHILLFLCLLILYGQTFCMTCKNLINLNKLLRYFNSTGNLKKQWDAFTHLHCTCEVAPGNYSKGSQIWFLCLPPWLLYLNLLLISSSSRRGGCWTFWFRAHSSPCNHSSHCQSLPHWWWPEPWNLLCKFKYSPALNGIDSPAIDVCHGWTPASNQEPHRPLVTLPLLLPCGMGRRIRKKTHKNHGLR